MKIIVHKAKGELIRLIVGNQKGDTASVELNNAACGKLSAMLAKCLESLEYSGSIDIGSEVTSSETIKKVLR